ncbi:hypothetical protein [Streptomyces sp. NPDC093990]|uniref:hypothetical protein n=1 Tax=Streptomyces sp. NPDC093990 TaxID=3155306 RepID=UPI003419757A
MTSSLFSVGAFEVSPYRAGPVIRAAGTPEPEQPGKVLDLMAALTGSVQQAKASRGEDTDADVHEMPKKRTAKKQPAKKAAATKTTKKTAARRSRSA